MDQDWLIIYNPTSGGGKAKKDKEKILQHLDELKINYKVAFTEYPGHATELTLDAIRRGERKIMAIGGDGTMNEVVNGIFSQNEVRSIDIAFGFIPVGTGNDWIRTIGIPNDYKGAARSIKVGNYFFQDVGVVTYQQDNQLKKRYFANVAGMGYDAFVTYRTNKKSKGKRIGKFAYLFNVLKCLFNYKATEVTIHIDGTEVCKESVFSMNVGICKYNGNGMMQVPHAIPDDGILDVTIIKQVSKSTVIQNTSKLYDGSFVEKDFVSTYSGNTVTVSSEPPIYLETDGESMGQSPFEFSLIHRGLKIISTLKNRQE